MAMQKRLSAAEAEVQAADKAAKETAFVALSLAELQEKYKALKMQYASEVAELQKQAMLQFEYDAKLKIQYASEVAELQKQAMENQDLDAKLKANNMLLREELAELQIQNLDLI